MCFVPSQSRSSHEVPSGSAVRGGGRRRRLLLRPRQGGVERVQGNI